MDYSLAEIHEENILALRSFLLDGPEAWAPLQDQIQMSDETAAEYMSLIFGAFETAVRRKFSPTYMIGDIVQFVADLRIAAREDAGSINALVTEDLIRRALNAPRPKDDGGNDLKDVVHAEVYVLLYIVSEKDYDRAGWSSSLMRLSRTPRSGWRHGGPRRPMRLPRGRLENIERSVPVAAEVHRMRLRAASRCHPASHNPDLPEVNERRRARSSEAGRGW